MSNFQIFPLVDGLAYARRAVLGLLVALCLFAPSASFAAGHEEGGSLDVKGIIFEHLGDGYNRARLCLSLTPTEFRCP